MTIKHDPTDDIPINYADAAWRNLRAGRISHEAAILIVKAAMRISEADAAAMLESGVSPVDRMLADCGRDQ